MSRNLPGCQLRVTTGSAESAPESQTAMVRGSFDSEPESCQCPEGFAQRTLRPFLPQRAIVTVSCHCCQWS